MSRWSARLVSAVAATCVLPGCSTNPRPSVPRPADVAGCYLVSVVGSAEVTGVFPDTIGLDSLPSVDTAGFLGTRIMISQAPRVQLLVWRMTTADSLEILASVAFKDIDLRAQVKPEGFAGTVDFTDASHTTTGSVTAKRAYCVGFGVK